MKSLLLCAFLMVPVQSEDFGVSCSATTCVVPKQLLAELVQAHENQMDEIRLMRRYCPLRNN